MAIDYSVPEWLRPPSEAERERQQLLSQQAAQKSALILQKQIGLRRMAEDTQAAIQSGVPREVAQQNALIKNAHLLFADQPEAVANIVKNEEVTRIRDEANLWRKQWQQGQLDNKQILADQAAEKAQMTAKHEQEKLEATIQRQKDIREMQDKVEKGKKKRAKERNALEEQLRQMTISGQQATAQERAQAETNRTLSTDKLLNTWTDQVNRLEKTLSERGEPSETRKSLSGKVGVGPALKFLGQSAEDYQAETKKIQQQIDALKKKIDDRKKELTGKPTATAPAPVTAPAPAPAPAATAPPKRRVFRNGQWFDE